MKKHPILLVLLAILIVQPLVTGNLATGTSAPDSEGVYSPAVGFRINPVDLTDHVPILIDEEADFVSQGWPGAGTSGDPYLISGLNITYSSGTHSISISDTTSYFVIRDCYINQGSVMQAIYMDNATHGTIEHNTMISDGGGIFFMQSNGTHVYHNDISNYGNGLFESSIVAIFSWDCEVERNLCYTDNNLGSMFSVCPNLILNYNSWENGNPATSNVVIDSCNDTVANHNTILNGDTGLILDSSINVLINNLTVISDDRGIEITDCPWFEITNSHIESPDGGLLLDNCPNATIMDSYFMSPLDAAIYASLSDDLTILGNTMEDSAAGIVLEMCAYIVIDSNTLNDIDEVGMFIMWCYELSITGNTMIILGDRGIDIFESGEIAIESNEIIGNFFEANIYLDDCFNGTIIGNTLDRMFMGVYYHWCINWTTSENTFNEGFVAVFAEENAWISIDDNIVNDNIYGFVILDVSNVEISYNELYNIEGEVWICEMTTNTSIHHNTVDTCDGLGYFGGCYNTTFNYNTITDCEYQGMAFYDILIGQVTGNTISSPVDGGLIFDSCYEFSITDNALNDCGIVFNTGNSLASYNHTFSNNLVNGQSVYYSVSEESATIDPTSYGQIILVNCSDIDIIGKTWGTCTIPIQLYYCDFIDIPDVTTTSNKYGVQAYQTDNVTITDIKSSGHESSAVYLDTCIDFYIEGLIQNGGDYGARIYNCDYGTLYLCTIDQATNGIYAPSTNDIDIINCDITNIDNSGIYGSGNYVKVMDSYISNAYYGIRVDGGDFWNITDNLIEYGVHGISVLSNAINGIAHNNEIYSCEHHGIILSTGSSNWEITNNTIFWMGMWGIHVYNSGGLDVYYNVIGLCGTGTADDNSGNTWDDTVDTGNWWSDYSGTGTYPLPGGGGSVDNYPMQFLPDTPLIQYPMDISYAEGSTGNTASWIVFDNYLSHYRVTIDGTVVVEDAFAEVQEDTATVDIDGLAYGDHTVVITVWDIEDNTATDTIMIHVFDDTDPTTNTPPNMEVFVGGSGQEITWEVSDLHPDTYTVDLDGEEYATGTWTSGEISINIDGLTEGEHTLVLFIYDIDGNEISDAVEVLVINDPVAPTVDSPDDIVIILGTTGNSIIWTPTDEYPASYEVSSNGSIYTSGDWGGSRIVLVVDGLPVGNHTFTLTVGDGSGNSATDTVLVTVLLYEGWTPEAEPADMMMTFIIVGAAAGVIIIVVVVFSKIKKSKS